MTALDWHHHIARVELGAKVRTWFAIRETPGRAPLIGQAAVTPTDLPDLDQDTPRGLRWVAPLESRPIALGLHDVAEVRPLLDLQAGRFWTGSRHGLAIGRAELVQHEAAIAYAFAPDFRAARAERAALTHAGAVLAGHMDHYIEEAFG